MRKYIVVTNGTADGLADMVQKMLEQGAQLMGGVAFSTGDFGGFAQAMTMPAKWKPK